MDNLRYRVDIPRLTALLLPALLRKPRLLAWLGALLAPLQQLYAAFLLYAEAARIELSYNGQVMVMQGMLNEGFDPDLRRSRDRPPFARGNRQNGISH